MHMKNFLVCAALTFVAFGINVTGVSAKQTSLDRQIFEAFEKIDDRTSAHEDIVVEKRARLEALTTEIARLQESIKQVPDRDDKSALDRRRIVQSQLINASAEYINVAFRLVDSAAHVISANLTDLANLAKELRNAEPGSGRVAEIRQRIAHGVDVGKSVRVALGELRNWTQQDPTLAARFTSLKRIAAALDRRISIDKARLHGRGADDTGRIHDKRLDSIDRSIDRLSDMYTEVVAEKEAIVDLRDEVAMAIQLGRLEMTRQIAETAIPSLSSQKSPAQDLTTLRDVANGIAKLNNSIAAETSIQEPPGVNPKTKMSRLSLGSFKNF